MSIPGVEGGNDNNKSFQEVMQRSFRVSDNSSVLNKDLDYRPAPVMSDYDDSTRFTQGNVYDRTRGSRSSFNKNDIRPPGTEEYIQEDNVFPEQTYRKRTFPTPETKTDLNESELGSKESQIDTSLTTSPNDLNVPPIPPKRSKEDSCLKIDYSPKFKFSCPDITDHSLPNELKLQFQPLFCKLCSMTLSSNTMARLHYVSKNHNKKIKNWLIQYSERTGEPLHPRVTSESKTNKKDQIENPSYYFCSACNLPLTGKLHSESHYMGRQHQKIVSESRHASGAVVVANYPEIFDNKSTLPFLKEGCADPAFPNADGNVPGDSKRTNLACELCSVRVTCREQLEQHLQGAKHKKKLKLIENMGSEKGSPDFAECRTPSGSFYCSVCKVTVNSAAQFRSHQESKKHRNKASASNNDV
ncbi:zinc finger matrin-type protein 4-like [Agrilus planipennis]|uniref:Zinc finger matrin-type protein 4-like n=1 Tax=Agrilus planipennis TaxID=224129 RepID=A0A1W4WNI6_AGRPL|nr:zinc finger matrin-type protein 4-like [Agrilus planipennis]